MCSKGYACNPQRVVTGHCTKVSSSLELCAYLSHIENEFVALYFGRPKVRYVWNAEEGDQDCASYSQLSEIRSAIVCGRLGLVQTSRSRSRSRSIHQRWNFQRKVKIKIGSEELHLFGRRWRRGSEWYPKRCPSSRIRFHRQVPFQSSCKFNFLLFWFRFLFQFFVSEIYLFVYIDLGLLLNSRISINCLYQIAIRVRFSGNFYFLRNRKGMR